MIHIYNNQQAGVGDWNVWSDPDEEEKLGRCIGTGRSKEDAVLNGIAELENDIRLLKRELSE